MKRQILDFKAQIKKKDEEIEKMRSSNKCLKFTELDKKYKKLCEENELTNQQLVILTASINE